MRAASQMDASLNFVFEVGSYHVKNCTFWADGDLDLSVEAQLSAQEEVSFDNTTHLMTVDVPDIHFSIGPIPFHINTTIPVDAELKLDASLKVVSTMSSRAKGTARFGVQYPYVHSDGSTENKPRQLSQWSVSHDGSFPSLSGAIEVQLGATLYLLPTFIINIDGIGGPQIGVKTYLESIADFSTTNGCQADYAAPGLPAPLVEKTEESSGGWHVVLNWGLQATASLFLDIKVGNLFEVGPFKSPVWQFFHTKKELGNGCWGGDGELTGSVGGDILPQLIPKPLLRGVTWSYFDYDPGCGDEAVLLDDRWYQRAFQITSVDKEQQMPCARKQLIRT